MLSPLTHYSDLALAAFYITIFSKSYCPHSRRAKELIGGLVKSRPNIIELDHHELGPQMQAYLLKKTGQRTVPNVCRASSIEPVLLA